MHAGDMQNGFARAQARRSFPGLPVATLVLLPWFVGCTRQQEHLIQPVYQGSATADGVAFFVQALMVKRPEQTEQRWSVVMCSPRTQPVCVRTRIEAMAPNAVQDWLQRAMAASRVPSEAPGASLPSEQGQQPSPTARAIERNPQGASAPAGQPRPKKKRGGRRSLSSEIRDPWSR